MIVIRPYRPHDADGVAAVVLRIQQEEFGIPITREAQPDLQDIPAFYQRNNGNFWVAEADEEVIGTIGLLDIGRAQAALRKMFVAQAHRGRERGVAKRLLDTLLDWSAGRGIEEIYPGTTDNFLAAHRFYAKNGFVEIARAALPATFPVMAVDTRFYRHQRGSHDG
jgi:N-acetylglutamate synthase-like GNAT family acetyltransferase